MWSSVPSTQPHEAERTAWLKQAHDLERRPYKTIVVSAHSLLLLLDIELAFRAGAWLSAIVLSHASVEANIRQVVHADFKSNAASLFGVDPDLQWLRGIRNEILHAAEPGTVSQIWKVASDNLVACQSELESEARRAVRLAYKSAYAKAEN